MFIDGNTSRDRYGGSSKSSWEPESKQPSSLSFSSEDRTSSRRSESSSSAVAASGDEAQKKFGSAKAISSDQYFGDAGDNNVRKLS